MILITGINGEIGHGLVKRLSNQGNDAIIGLDINQPNNKIKQYIHKFYEGSILDEELLTKIFSEFKFTSIYHLAAILSTKAESNPFQAHQVNVQGFINLVKTSLGNTERVKFFFPSSIAVYYLNDKHVPPFSEDMYCNPNNIYGCNKLYCEKLGAYFSEFSEESSKFDFRSIRFSGIISSTTLPTGGTSDYASEIIHSAIQNKNYCCFVNKNSKIPFMAMPDAIDSIIKIMSADKKDLSQSVYHTKAFNPSVEEIFVKIKNKFPQFELTYNINKERQRLVDSWPSDIDDSKARKDWGWNPIYDFDKAFENYLIPEIIKFYQEE